MATIKEEALEYKPAKISNISELEEVPIDIEVHEKAFMRDDGTSFTSKIVTVKGNDYRVPKSVLRDLKNILVRMPQIKKFRVLRSGVGKDGTRYQVIPA